MVLASKFFLWQADLQALRSGTFPRLMNAGPKRVSVLSRGVTTTTNVTRSPTPSFMRSVGCTEFASLSRAVGIRTAVPWAPQHASFAFTEKLVQPSFGRRDRLEGGIPVLTGWIHTAVHHSRDMELLSIDE